MLDITSLQKHVSVSHFYVIVPVNVSRCLSGVGFPASFFIDYGMVYHKIKNILNDTLFFVRSISIQQIRQMAAQLTDELVHVCFVFMLELRLHAVLMLNNAICFLLDDVCQVCKQHGNPEFLQDRVLGVSTETGQADFFFYELVLFLDVLYESSYKNLSQKTQTIEVLPENRTILLEIRLFWVVSSQLSQVFIRTFSKRNAVF